MSKPTSFKSVSRPECCSCIHVLVENGERVHKYYCDRYKCYTDAYNDADNPWERRDVQTDHEVNAYDWCADYKDYLEVKQNDRMIELAYRMKVNSDLKLKDLAKLCECRAAEYGRLAVIYNKRLEDGFNGFISQEMSKVTAEIILLG